MGREIYEEEEASNVYAFGVNVESSDELYRIAIVIRNFMETIGEGTAEIQVAINPNLVEQSAYEELSPAIGFAVPDESEIYYEEEDDGEDD